MINGKRGNLNSFVIQAILVALIFALFLMAISGKVNGRNVRQQVLEKQTALLVDSAESGMEFGVRKINVKGLVDSLEVKNGRVFASVDGLGMSKGYPYFSKYDVSVVDSGDKFIVKVL